MADVILASVPINGHVSPLLEQEGALEYGIVLEGGTSLRKLRAGNAGRFSTDLDFATPDVDTANFVIDDYWVQQLIASLVAAR